MIRVNVLITNISAERFLDIKKPIPPVQINTNINVIGFEKKADESLEAPFILAINFNPSIAQITLKGKAYVAGEKSEIEKIYRDYEGKKPPPPVVIQSISNVALVESVIISRTLNLPPPIPLPQIPEMKTQTEREASGREYTA